MLRDFNWLTFLMGVAFAMFVWPFVMSVFSNMRAKTSKATS